MAEWSAVVVTEPTDEDVRIAVGLVRLTWLQSMVLAHDEDIVLHMTLLPREDFDSAPEGAKDWLRKMTSLPTALADQGEKTDGSP